MLPVLQRLRAALPRLWSLAPSAERCEFRVVKPLTEPLSGQQVCVFAHYDVDGLIDDHVLYHLGALRQAGLLVILVTTSARVSASEFHKLDELCAAVIERENIGLDFGSWLTALQIYPALLSAQLLVLANDSVYGPVCELQPILMRMADEPCDFWGVTESREVKPHYQSYFLAFKRTALTHPALRAWLGGLRLLRDKQEIINRYELELTSYLLRHGLRGSAVVTADPANKTSEPPRNPMHHGWRNTLARGGPYLKVELLRDNPFHLPIAEWPAHLTALAPATPKLPMPPELPALPELPELIDKHLARIKARR